jgi:hypothetical protein
VCCLGRRVFEDPRVSSFGRTVSQRPHLAADLASYLAGRCGDRSASAADEMFKRGVAQGLQGVREPGGFRRGAGPDGSGGQLYQRRGPKLARVPHASQHANVYSMHQVRQLPILPTLSTHRPRRAARQSGAFRDDFLTLRLQAYLLEEPVEPLLVALPGVPQQLLWRCGSSVRECRCLHGCALP